MLVLDEHARAEVGDERGEPRAVGGAGLGEGLVGRSGGHGITIAPASPATVKLSSSFPQATFILSIGDAGGTMVATAPIRALIIEDAPEIAELVRTVLEQETFDVEVCGDGDAGLAAARDRVPDVVVLDVTLPGIDGIEVCRRLRTFSDAYVVMLTGRAEETDRLIGLAVGADDYVTKPFSPKELVARIRAMLRRPRAGAPVGGGAADDGIRHFGDLTIDVGAREVLLDGAPVELSKLEFDILGALSEHARISLSRDQLLERVWGPNWFGDDHVIDVHVSNLRRKLGDDPRNPRFVRTVRGFGYRMGDGGQALPQR